MYVDSHNHTSLFSADASMKAGELFLAARSADLRGVVITEHYEMDYPHFLNKELIFDVDAYFHSLSADQASIPSGLSVFSGIELGYQSHLVDFYNQLTSSHPFDSIILSNHLYKGQDPYFFRECYLEPKHIVFGNYVNELTEMVLSGIDFDIVGHFDYMSRYAPYEDPRLYYSDAPDEIDRFLSAIILKKKSLEINTRSINKLTAKGFLDGFPDKEIMRRYLSLGGDRVTLGSDSHDPSTVGCLFRETAAFLQSCGFQEVTTYECRKEIRTPIL